MADYPSVKNRQDAVRGLAKMTDIILVIGSQNSSNSNRLRDLAVEVGVESHLINDVSDIDIKWFDNIKRVGITAGASAPEILIDKIIGFFQEKFEVTIKTMDGEPENVVFKLPKEVA